MATKQSPLISNANAAPQTLNDPAKDGARVRYKTDTVEADTSNLSSTGDTVELCDLPSNAVVTDIIISNDALDGGSALTMDLGLWNINSDGSIGSAASDDVYISDSTYFQAVTPLSSYLLANRNRDQLGNHVWEDAGASSDPNTKYRLALKVENTASSGQQGTVSFQVKYSTPA